MTPFILKQHEKDLEQLRELEATEIDSISGGGGGVVRLPTVTITGTRNADGSDGGCDGSDGGAL